MENSRASFLSQLFNSQRPETTLALAEALKPSPITQAASLQARGKGLPILTGVLEGLSRALAVRGVQLAAERRNPIEELQQRILEFQTRPVKDITTPEQFGSIKSRFGVTDDTTIAELNQILETGKALKPFEMIPKEISEKEPSLAGKTIEEGAALVPFLKLESQKAEAAKRELNTAEVLRISKERLNLAQAAAERSAKREEQVSRLRNFQSAGGAKLVTNLLNLNSSKNLVISFQKKYEDLEKQGLVGPGIGTLARASSLASYGLAFPKVKSYEDERESFVTKLKPFFNQSGQFAVKEIEFMLKAIPSGNEAAGVAKNKFSTIMNDINQKINPIQGIILRTAGPELGNILIGNIAVKAPTIKEASEVEKVEGIFPEVELP